MSVLKCVILTLFVSMTLTMYDRNTPVTVLKAKDFDRVNKGIWLV
jgi:hypothetical protein